MAPAELPAGDLGIVIALTEKTSEKCKAKGDDFQEVTRILQSMRLMALSIQLSLKDRYDKLSIEEQESLNPILIGIEKTLGRILRDAEAVAPTPSVSPYLFRVLGLDISRTIDPRDSAAKIVMWMSTLKEWMRTVVRGAPEVDYTSTAGLASQPLADEKKTIGPPKLTPQIEQTVQDWTRFNGKEAFEVRGIYTYGYKPSQSLLTQEDDPTDLTLQLKDGKISGTAEDSAGTSQIEGEINSELGTIRFIKSYGAWNFWGKWEYSGRFTEWGVVGIWHAPGTPNSTWIGTGRFALWIDGDRAASEIAETLAEMEEKSVAEDKC